METQQKSTKELFIIFLKALKAPILNILKTQAAKFLIAKLVKSAFMADFRIWLIEFAIEHLVEELVKPLVNLTIRKAGYYIEVIDGKHLLKKINDSTTVDEWNNNIDEV